MSDSLSDPTTEPEPTAPVDDPGHLWPLADYASGGLALDEQFAKVLATRAISPAVARERGYSVARTRGDLERFGFKGGQLSVVSSKNGWAALIIPLSSPAGVSAGVQMRPDQPRMTENGKPLKYERPAGALGKPWDVPVGARQGVNLKDTPIIIVEGPLKADSYVTACQLAGMASGQYAIAAVMGVTMGVNVTEITADRFDGREVWLAGDSDAWPGLGFNLDVAKAMVKLSKHLTEAGAVVRWLRFGDGSTNKEGLDDFIVGHLTAHAARNGGDLHAAAVDTLADLRGILVDDAPSFDGSEAVSTGKNAPIVQLGMGISEADAAVYQQGAQGPTCVANFIARVSKIKRDRDPDTGETTPAQYILEVQSVVDGRVASVEWPVNPEDLDKVARWSRQIPSFPHLQHARGVTTEATLATAFWAHRADERQTVDSYGSSGWTEAPDAGWVWLHAGGSIGETGALKYPRFDAPTSLYQNFAMPDPPATREEACELLSTVLDLMALWPTPGYAATLLAVPHRAVAPKRTFTPVMLQGPPAAGKTQSAQVLQSFTAVGFGGNNPAASFADTGNRVERVLQTIRHGVVAIDDLTPAALEQGGAAVLERITRGVKDGQRRGRLTRESKEQESRPIKSLPVMSAERLPMGRLSTLQRLVILTFGDNRKINFDYLNEAKQNARAGLYARHMAGFIKWLAAFRNSMGSARAWDEWWDARWREMRHAATEAGLGTDRTAEGLADLAHGWVLLHEYARTIGYAGDNLPDMDDIWANLKKVAREHHEIVAAESPAEVATRGLTQAFASGHIHVSTPSGNAPDPKIASLLGWRENELMKGDWRPAPGAERSGFVLDGARRTDSGRPMLALLHDVVFEALSRRDPAIRTMGREGFARGLREAGWFEVEPEKDRNSARVKIGDSRVRGVLPLSMDAVLERVNELMGGGTVIELDAHRNDPGQAEAL